jgi:hypothetical protein
VIGSPRRNENTAHRNATKNSPSLSFFLSTTWSHLKCNSTDTGNLIRRMSPLSDMFDEVFVPTNSKTLAGIGMLPKEIGRRRNLEGRYNGNKLVPVGNLKTRQGLSDKQLTFVGTHSNGKSKQTAACSSPRRQDVMVMSRSNGNMPSSLD